MTIQNNRERVPRLQDANQPQQSLAGPESSFFRRQFAQPLDRQEAPELVHREVNKLSSLNESEKQQLIKVVIQWLHLIPDEKLLGDQPRKLVNFTQCGLPTVPGYKPEPKLGSKLGPA